MEEKGTSKLKGAFAKNAASSGTAPSEGLTGAETSWGESKPSGGLKGSMSDGFWEKPTDGTATSSGLKGATSSYSASTTTPPMPGTPVTPPLMSGTPVTPPPMSGTPTYDAPAPAPMSTVPAKKSTGKILGIILGSCAVIGALVIGAFFLFNSKGGYMEPIDDFVAQVNKRNSDLIDMSCELLPDSCVAEFKAYTEKLEKIDELWETYEEYMEDIQDSYDECDDEFGKWKLSFEVKDAEECSSKELKNITKQMEADAENMEETIEWLESCLTDSAISQMADTYDVSESDIEEMYDSLFEFMEAMTKVSPDEAYKIKGKFVIEADDDTFETETLKIYVVSIDGDWMLQNIEGSLLFEDDDDRMFSFIRTLLKADSLVIQY